MHARKTRWITTKRNPYTPHGAFCMIGNGMCHFAPGAPLSTQNIPTKIFPMMKVSMHCHTLSPNAISDDPVVHPPILKDPVITQRVTNSQGPNVRLSGGRGRVSKLAFASIGAPSFLLTSRRLRIRFNSTILEAMRWEFTNSTVQTLDCP